jgi:hypothetical protein
LHVSKLRYRHSPLVGIVIIADALILHHLLQKLLVREQLAFGRLQFVRGLHGLAFGAYYAVFQVGRVVASHPTSNHH